MMCSRLTMRDQAEDDQHVEEVDFVAAAADDRSQRVPFAIAVLPTPLPNATTISATPSSSAVRLNPNLANLPWLMLLEQHDGQHAHQAPGHEREAQGARPEEAVMNHERGDAAERDRVGAREVSVAPPGGRYRPAGRG